jgi:putative aldouronate transport system permease protein
MLKKPLGEKTFDWFNIFIMSALLVILVYPMLYCLFASISDPAKLALHKGPLLYPLGLSFVAYKNVFSNSAIVRGFFYTIFYVVAGTLLNLLITSFASYVLSRRAFFGKRFLMLFIVITMYFGGGLIPFYLVVKNLGMIDTVWAMIIPTAMNAFYMIIMRTYFLSIPFSLEESAILDGANDFTILFRIILPLAMPVVAVMIIYYGVDRWNSWFHAMLFIMKRQEIQPLQLILWSILLQNDLKLVKSTDLLEGQQIARLIKYALIIITTLPIITLYPFMQKYFIKGVMIGSIKE